MRETLSNLDDRVQDKSREASDAGRDLRDFIQNRDKSTASDTAGTRRVSSSDSCFL